ncbi:MAG: hypothetical protein LBH50_06745 [Spirochaetaceae bacterium]|jgi:hypothetical protein|nr:hypothetical protein [Spirochaetaceae bacterium]
MKNVFCGFAIFVMMLGNNILVAEDNDVPYLLDGDIALLELILPYDTADVLWENAQNAAAKTKGTVERNEISSLNTPRTIYHLLILDRRRCSLNADIGNIKNSKLLYKFKHGANGYLIAVYTSPEGGPVFPQLPDRSNILVDLLTARKDTIKEYINSSSFRQFVTNRRIRLQIQRALDASLSK